MEIKHYHQRQRRIIRADRWFLVILGVVAVAVFIIANILIGQLLKRNQLEQLQVKPLEEGAAYDGQGHTLAEDFALLSETHASYLNGSPIAKIAGTEQPIAVVVENYTPIRDEQSGLDKASIVYETLAEGGITRLLAIFDGVPVDRIGPVRSARPYFVDWASEYRAALAHVGGSSEALGDLKASSLIYNLDEFSDSTSIWRDNTYLAPHNAFTSTEKILKRLEKENYSHPLTKARFPFKDNDAQSGSISTITIDFSFTPYAVKYVYDPTAHLYSRFNGGKAHHDLKPANVLVQFVDMEVLDDAGRLRLQTQGKGKAIVFRDGQAIEGTWEKDPSINSENPQAPQAFTKFLDKNGKEIPLNRGQTWIEVVPNGRLVNYF